MIIYFADRKMNILGHASTNLPEGFVIVDDLKAEDVETGISSFECTIGYKKENRLELESMTMAGNYILYKDDDETGFFTIIDSEPDTREQTVYIYAEDAGLDLINEIVGDFEATEAQTAEWYINKFAYDSGFEIKTNEIPESSKRTLKWEGESTVTERIASIATQFGSYEVAYTFDIDGLQITHKYINIYEKRGKDIGQELRLNRDIDRIITKRTVKNLATALKCKGGTPEESDSPITLEGYSYDDGDFYVDGDCLKSRKALEKWSRYQWEKRATGGDGHITRLYSYDTTSQATLCAHALTELKKICDMEVNYEVDITKLPDNVKIGDRINIVDDAGELYLSTRILLLERSETQQSQKATLGEHLIKTSGISQKVEDLAAQFAATVYSAERALEIANNAKEEADNAQDKADQAIKDAGEAQEKADAATDAAGKAEEKADAATDAANQAQAKVEEVQNDVSGLEQTIQNAQDAADNAWQAADTAQQKAEEAEQAATNALQDAAEAKQAAEQALENADSTLEKAEAAIKTAEAAESQAEAAEATANGAKADAALAQQKLKEFQDGLETEIKTMKAEYARKTDLSELESDMQTQITQNAAEIASTASSVTKIDETANDAQKQLIGAAEWVEKAHQQADEATAEAEAAQRAADAARAAANAAQNEADTARAAADTATSVANQAEADLKAAEEDLATVQSRADATEEEIAEAQAAVDAAKIAANEAQAEADEAIQVAEDAQKAANKAVASADEAQLVADSAVEKAELAQQAAEQAEGDATAAQQAANEAKAAADEAQETANTAKQNAINAQMQADEAAQTAADSQAAADAAEEKALEAEENLAQAQVDLEAVMNKVDATEEEVQKAQDAVNKAQASATTARTEANEAQATADQAKADAQTAQTAANEAKTAADEAQAAADEAQKAYDKAKVAVDGLAVRMIDAETQIRHNSEEIDLRATKQEVAKSLGGIYTKRETEALVKVEADEIKSRVSDVEYTAENANDRIDETNGRMTTAESLIQQLSNSISMLVTDGNGASLMTQTSDGGWTFSMAETNEAVNNLSQQLDALNKETGDVNATVTILQQLVNDMGETLAYVRIGTWEEEPCIDLGKSGSDYSLMITNTRILFRVGSNVPTLINSTGVVTENIEVENDFKQGYYIWKERSNGHYGLRWQGFPPTITKQPGSVTLVNGGEAKFSIEATGRGLSYTWQRRAKGGTTWHSSTIRKPTYIVVTSSSSSAFVDEYRCIVTDKYGQTVISDTVTLTNTVRPVITKHPESMTVAKGETFTLSVEATGIEPLTYQWQYNNGTGTSWNNATGDAATTATWTRAFSTSTTLTTQRVRCIVTDAEGNSTTSNEATMTIT